MKTILLIFLLLCASFCSENPLMTKNMWETTASYADPKHDKKLSLIHKKLSKISAYENVKENVCPANRASWGVWKHLETGKIFVENDFQTLPWNKAVAEANRFSERHKMTGSASLVNQFNAHHAEMKPFVRCLGHCFDLSAMFESAVQRNEHVNKFFLIESLVDAGFALNDDVKKTLPWYLWRAIHYDKTELTRALIALGALNAKNDSGATALHIAASTNSAKVARVLIEKRADKDATDNDGKTSLHRAAMYNSADFARVLIENGADKDAKDNNGATSLKIAKLYIHDEVEKVLIETKSDKYEQSHSQKIQII